MKPIVPRSIYSKRLSKGISFKRPSRTKQAFTKQCDINNVLNIYTSTGQLTHTSNRPPVFADLPSKTFHESLNHVLAAEASFDSMPSAIRRRFNGDIGKFLEFIENPSNLSDMAELGLAIPEPTPTSENALPDVTEPLSDTNPE